MGGQSHSAPVRRG